jgi:uncharacterized protein (TIRG00374 family)
MKNRWALLGLALSLVALAVLASRFGVSHAVAALSHANWWWVAASALAHILSTIVEAARWDTIISSVTPKARLWDAIVAMCVGTIGNLVLPLKLGEGARAWALARLSGLRFSTALSTVIADRVVESGVFLVSSVVFAVIYPPAGWLLRRVVVALLILIVMAGVLFLVSRRYGRSRLDAAGGVRGSLAHAMLTIERAVVSLRSTRHLGRACTVSVLSWTVKTLVVWTMFKAFGFDLSFVAAGASLVIIILGVVSVSTPGNVGMFELSTVLAVAIHGIPADTALGFAVILHAAEIVPTVILGSAAMWKLGIHMSDLAAKAAESDEVDLAAGQ